MPPFIYRCPNTGFRVQGFAPDNDESEGADDVFVGVTCLGADQCMSSTRKQARRPAKAANSRSLTFFFGLFVALRLFFGKQAF